MARLALLEKEKAFLRTADAIKEELRALPMVTVTKNYVFQDDGGPVSLKELFGSNSQLIIYHFMFEPTAEEGCHGCSFMAANFPDLRHLAQKDTALAVVSRAPIEKITAFKKKNFWTFPWVSSLDSDFNYDFQATIDDKVVPDKIMGIDHTAKPGAEAGSSNGDQPGLSVFKLQDGQVYHTYSPYERIEGIAGTYNYLDLTPAGRQEGPNGPAEFKIPADYVAEGQLHGR